jgi:hypothetical protein
VVVGASLECLKQVGDKGKRKEPWVYYMPQKNVPFFNNLKKKTQNVAIF